MKTNLYTALINIGLNFNSIKIKPFVILSFILFIPACVTIHDPAPNNGISYKTDNLAKDWREQVKINPNNPYENRTYPTDNDNDYAYPEYRAPRSQVTQPSTPNQNSLQQFYGTKEGGKQNYSKSVNPASENSNNTITAKNFPEYFD